MIRLRSGSHAVSMAGRVFSRIRGFIEQVRVWGARNLAGSGVSGKNGNLIAIELQPARGRNASPVDWNCFVSKAYLRTSHSGESRNPGKVADFSGFPKFTNEVQHFGKVLPWNKNMPISPLKSVAKLPDYKPRGYPYGKSRQLWIARHRQLLER